MARRADRGVAEVWRERLQRQARSGLSVAEFCRREQVSQPSSYTWRRRLAAEDPANERPLFVPVEVSAGLRRSAGVEIELPSGAVVRLPEDARRRVTGEERSDASADSPNRAGASQAPPPATPPFDRSPWWRPWRPSQPRPPPESLDI